MVSRQPQTTSAARIPRWMLGTAGVVVALIILELLPRLQVVPAQYLPPVSSMLIEVGKLFGEPVFWGSLFHTIITWVVGLAISLVFGVLIGILLGMVPWLREFTNTTVEFLRPVPSVALIPVAVLLLGTGMTSTLLLVVYASFWQVLIQVMAGVQDVDPVAADTARSYRFRGVTRIRTLIWPTALPYAMTGLRLAASVALVLTVTGELLISGEGIGGELATARESGAVARMYAFVIIAGVLGVLVNMLARAIEHRTLSWHPSIRAEAHV